MKREAKFQTVFNEYIREKKLHGYFELKQTSSEYWSYAELPPHQRQGLAAAEANGLVWKLSDADPRQKPFDSFSAPPMNAYLVIKYPRCIVMIRIENLLLERSQNPNRKSLYVARARQIAERIILTK